MTDACSLGTMAKRYRCPGCGKRVKFGTHYCSGDAAYTTAAEPRMDDPADPWRDSRWFRVLKKVLIVVVASALVLVLLIGSLGLYLSLILLAVITVIATAILLLREFTGIGPRESGSYSALVKLLHGDSDAADRLIASEMEKHPEFSRNECTRRVYDRLVYERSR